MNKIVLEQNKFTPIMIRPGCVNPEELEIYIS